MCGRKLHGCWRTRRSHRADSPAPASPGVSGIHSNFPKLRWQRDTLPSLLKNLVWKQGEGFYHPVRAQIHLVAIVYPRLSKRSKLGTRGNIVTLKYSLWEAGDDSRSVLQSGGDIERGQRAAAGAYTTHHEQPHGGNPTFRDAAPTLGDADPGIPRCSSPGGIPARPRSPLLS